MKLILINQSNFFCSHSPLHLLKNANGWIRNLLLSHLLGGHTHGLVLGFVEIFTSNLLCYVIGCHMNERE